MREILVSICCSTYNHERYIADALEGFVKQKTNFSYEVLIHDDASTDRTAEIIREYEKKYPDIIKPIYQTENQFSKGIEIDDVFLYPIAKGKYLATCEGDDYWIDPEKLQKQVDYMEAHPACSLCFTNGLVEEDGEMRGRRAIPFSKFGAKTYKHGDADYDMGEMVLLDYVPTASLLYRKKDWINPPQLSPDSFVGDNYLRFYSTSCGYAHCIDDDTCVYRFGVPGSVSTGWKEDPQIRYEFCQEFLSLLDDMDRLTDRKYAAQIQIERLRHEAAGYELMENYRALRNRKYHAQYRERGTLEYAKFIAKIYCPWIYKKLRAMKCALKK